MLHFCATGNHKTDEKNCITHYVHRCRRRRREHSVLLIETIDQDGLGLFARFGHSLESQSHASTTTTTADGYQNRTEQQQSVKIKVQYDMHCHFSKLHDQVFR